jgi:hypothetical protein
VCDQFKAHVTESIERLATKLKTHLAVIPGGLTSQLQPLDVSVNKPFKGFMHEEWAKWNETAFDFLYLRVGEKFLAAS